MVLIYVKAIYIYMNSWLYRSPKVTHIYMDVYLIISWGWLVRIYTHTRDLNYCGVYNVRHVNVSIDVWNHSVFLAEIKFE